MDEGRGSDAHGGARRTERADGLALVEQWRASGRRRLGCFDIAPGETSASTTTDPDTLIFRDGTVVKIHDGTVVVVTNDEAMDSFDPSDLSFISPLGQVVDQCGLSGAIGQLFGRPDLHFGPSVATPGDFGDPGRQHSVSG